LYKTLINNKYRQKKIVAGNWNKKFGGSTNAYSEVANMVADEAPDGVQIIMAPPSIYLCYSKIWSEIGLYPL
jgi:hypothetical protein